MRAHPIAIACLAFAASACCTEQHCDRAEVIGIVRDMAEGEIDDCGHLSTHTEEEILACIDEAVANERGFLYSFIDGLDFEYTFVETANGEHWQINADPDRKGAERMLCPETSMYGLLPDCDWDTRVRDEIICDNGSCGVAVAGH